MDRKQFLVSVAGASLGGTIASSCMANGRPKSPSPPKSSLALTILSASIPQHEVVTSADGMPPRILQVSPDDPHFHVALRNVSTQPVRIWNEDSSWGSGNLTLEISAIGARQLLQPIKVVRKVTAWYRNDATFTEMPPGEMILREVSIEVPKGWHGAQTQRRPWLYEGFPMEAIRGTNMANLTAFQMRAVFAIEQDGFTEKEKVWTGKITSPEHTYMLNRTDIL
jgi:hypothetical protein